MFYFQRKNMAAYLQIKKAQLENRNAVVITIIAKASSLNVKHNFDS